uniref:Uncharacterized protein n=1 Tax=viral metagenome TaxID=1070528 RepID=A0A6H1ZKT1_9ZZZZ
MQPQVIVVHDIHKSIEDVGVLPYANTICQDMGGEYWFVDAELLTEKQYKDRFKNLLRHEMDDRWEYQELKKNSEGEVRIFDWWRWRAWHVPLKLAHFIIETLRLKAQFGRLGVGDIDEPVKQAVYLTPGTKIFGHEVTELTEIQAELRPVVIGRL